MKLVLFHSFIRKISHFTLPFHTKTTYVDEQFALETFYMYKLYFNVTV